MIFYRHPTPDAPPGICYGRRDIGLSPEAAAEIDAACAAATPFSAVQTSPSRRALALAGPMAARQGVPLRVDERLMELDFGVWEGLRWDRIDRRASDPWAADPWNVAPPGGETFRALCERVGAALADCPPGACLVTHAGPIRAAKMILTGAGFDEVFAWRPPFATPIDIAAPATAR